MRILIKIFLFTIVILSSVNAQNDKIKVYFNKWVDNSASSVADAQRVIDIDDTVIAYIDRAKYSIDYCVYNTNLTQIITALNNAYERGVAVRVIVDDDAYNSALSGLNSNINYITSLGSGIMHNKFLVIDIEDPENTYLITGSVNFTYTNVFEDYNNMVIIQDNQIASAYKDEFNEMWGATGIEPNTSNSKFGSYKTDNTEHFFNVNGTDIEVYFSPSDGVTQKIENTIYTADNNIFFALLYLTRDDLGDAIVDQYNNGVEVKGMIEEIDAWGSEYQYLLSNNIEVYSFYDEPGMLHHKYAIIDPFNENSDPIVITGSHNWSTSAETSNDENTLIIHDYYIANEFYEEFYARLKQVGIENIDNYNFKINETSNYIEIESIKHFTCFVYDISGKILKEYDDNNYQKIDKNAFQKGMYLLKFGNKTIKFISK